MIGLKTAGKAIAFVVLYIVVFYLLAQLSVYVALVGAILATKWVMKRGI
ncbi:MAG: hypothetical protein Q7U88_15685 [Desulfocapsaceae bacterium]|nr:hypothetical protein [Desulfocapsaceae bacterium]